MAQRRLDLTLEKLGAGFDATSQLADRPKGNIFQHFAALISGYAKAKYQVWEKGDALLIFRRNLQSSGRIKGASFRSWAPIAASNLSELDACWSAGIF